MTLADKYAQKMGYKDVIDMQQKLLMYGPLEPHVRAIITALQVIEEEIKK